MTGRQSYFCADGRHIPEGHDFEECPPCLRAQRDGIRKEYEANVNTDLVARLREMDWRVRCQRNELARLQTVKPPPLVKVDDAFEGWVARDLNRWDRRFAHCAFEAGWHAARRALQPEGEEP